MTQERREEKIPLDFWEIFIKFQLYWNRCADDLGTQVGMRTSTDADKGPQDERLHKPDC